MPKCLEFLRLPSCSEFPSVTLNSKSGRIEWTQYSRRQEGYQVWYQRSSRNNKSDKIFLVPFLNSFCECRLVTRFHRRSKTSSEALQLLQHCAFEAGRKSMTKV